MKKIIVYGGGALALEIVSYLRDIEVVRPGEICFKGVFVPDGYSVRSEELNQMAPNASVFRNIDDLDSTDFHFVVGVGDPVLRFRLHFELVGKGFRLYTVKHPHSVIDLSATIGEGSVLAPFTFVGPFAIIGPSVLLNTYASVGHDASVGLATSLSPYACLNGNATAGRACFFGSHSALLPWATMGDMCKLSAGSIFSKTAESGSMIHGNPAKSRIMMRVTLD